MSIVILRLPGVKRKTEVRPEKCPYCHGETFQRWGEVRKPVRDNRYRSVQVYRYRCCSCQRTFRHYPAGVDRADQTQRLRKLVALGWVLGMSLRGVGIFLSAFGVTVSHMTVWRDLQEQAKILEQRRRWQPGPASCGPTGWAGGIDSRAGGPQRRRGGVGDPGGDEARGRGRAPGGGPDQVSQCRADCR